MKKKSLLIICQKVDDTDDLLGFFVSWLEEFSHHYSKVSVITLGTGHYDLPANVRVYSLGKESGKSKLHQAIRFKLLMLRLTGTHDAVFCHMSPIFAIAAWPFTFFFRKRLILWYLHRRLTLRLRLALALCDRLVTADSESLTIKSSKISSVGHGIDIDRFSTMRDWDAAKRRPLRILSVGRLSPIKGYEVLIRAVSLSKIYPENSEVRIVGKPVMAGDIKYAQGLRELTNGLGLVNKIDFFGFVPYLEMPKHYSWADVIVGCTPPGGLDKAILEGMAAGCIPITSNTVMKPYLAGYASDLLFSHGNSEELASRIDALDNMAAISEKMVAEVRRSHDLKQAITRITALT